MTWWRILLEAYVEGETHVEVRSVISEARYALQVKYPTITVIREEFEKMEAQDE